MCEGYTVRGEGLAKTCWFGAELCFRGCPARCGTNISHQPKLWGGKVLAQWWAHHKNQHVTKITGFRVGIHGETTSGFAAPGQPSVLAVPCERGHLCPPSFSQAAGCRKKWRDLIFFFSIDSLVPLFSPLIKIPEGLPGLQTFFPSSMQPSSSPLLGKPDGSQS